MNRPTIVLLAVGCFLSITAQAHAGDTTANTGQDRPLKIYILAGQSNMQGKATWYVLPGLADDPSTRHLYDRFVDKDGIPRACKDVYVAAVSEDSSEKNGPLTIGFGNKLNGKMGVRDKYAMCWGPEWGFGVTMQEQLKTPVLIVKTSWGGKSLNTDFRPPSAGPKPYAPDELKRLMEKTGKTEAEIAADRAEKTGRYYRLMVEQVKRVLADPGTFHPAYHPQQGVEIAGFVWFQGWNDMCDKNTYPGQGPERFAPYSELLAHFIRDVRKEFGAPDMRFVIGVMGTGDRDFRPAMAAPANLPEFKGNVVAVHTEQYLDLKLNELVDRSWRWQRPAWDPEKKYTELRETLLPLKKELDSLKSVEDRAERAKRQSELKSRIQTISYSPEEIEYMKNNRSSQGYHYNGSPKFFARIGEAFARAMLKPKE